MFEELPMNTMNIAFPILLPLLIANLVIGGFICFPFEKQYDKSKRLQFFIWRFIFFLSLITMDIVFGVLIGHLVEAAKGIDLLKR